MSNKGYSTWRWKMLLHRWVDLGLILRNGRISRSCNAGYLFRIYAALSRDSLFSHAQPVCRVHKHRWWLIWRALYVVHKLWGSLCRLVVGKWLCRGCGLAEVVVCMSPFLSLCPCSSRYFHRTHLRCQATHSILSSLLKLLWRLSVKLTLRLKALLRSRESVWIGVAILLVASRHRRDWRSRPWLLLLRGLPIWILVVHAGGVSVVLCVCHVWGRVKRLVILSHGS